MTEIKNKNACPPLRRTRVFCFPLLLSFIVVLNEQIIGGTFQNIANRFEIFKFDGGGFIFYNLFKILIA